MDMVETYKVKTYCDNCGRYNKKMDIPKGKLVSEIECPTCGCKGYLRYYGLARRAIR